MNLRGGLNNLEEDNMYNVLIVWKSPDEIDRIVVDFTVDSQDHKEAVRRALKAIEANKNRSEEMCYGWPDSMVDYSPDLIKISLV